MSMVGESSENLVCQASFWALYLQGALGYTHTLGYINYDAHNLYPSVLQVQKVLGKLEYVGCNRKWDLKPVEPGPARVILT